MPVGRPRNFDIDRALDQAMLVFWRKGYNGTSMPDLTEAMGIKRPSLYAAFGNKEALFEKVLDRYRNGPASYVDRAIENPTSREVFESLLHGVIELLTDPDHPGGCLFVQAGLGRVEPADPIHRELAGRRLAGEDDIRQRFERAEREGDLPSGFTASSLARYTASLLWGMSVLSAGGADREKLTEVAEHAIRCWPAA